MEEIVDGAVAVANTSAQPPSGCGKIPAAAANNFTWCVTRPRGPRYLATFFNAAFPSQLWESHLKILPFPPLFGIRDKSPTKPPSILCAAAKPDIKPKLATTTRRNWLCRTSPSPRLPASGPAKFSPSLKKPGHDWLDRLPSGGLSWIIGVF